MYLLNYVISTNTPNYPHKNNADNSIKKKNSELPKIIRTLFTSAH